MKNVITILFLTITTLTFGQFTSKDSLMISEINKVRTNPSSYISKAQLYIKMCEKKLEMIQNGSLTTSTDYNKHIDAAKELISILDTMTPVNALTTNIDMQSVTITHAVYLKSINRISHTNSNGETAVDRMKDINVKNVTENIATDNGIASSAVILLLVDAEIESRGHRNNILDPNAKFISVTSNGDYWIMNFAN